MQTLGLTADKCRKVTMPIVEDSACRQVYGSSVIADSMICTARSSFDVGPCAKDLGSPLFTRDPLEMVGFYSWDWGCDVVGRTKDAESTQNQTTDPSFISFGCLFCSVFPLI